MISPISLGSWPTPLEAAPRLAARLDLDELWIKRDDLGGLGGGGNKVRKLQYTCAQDPTYTGRAMAAMLEGTFPRGRKVVFLHSGGLPGLFAR